MEGWVRQTEWKNGMMEYWNDGNGRQVKGNVGILEYWKDGTAKQNGRME